MIMQLSQFEVKGSSTIYNLDSFSDVKYLKKYLKQSDNKSKALPRFDQIIKIVDTFSQMRAEAEFINKISNYSLAFNKDKQLPINWDNINNLVNPSFNENLNEPPNRLINIIAKENFSTIKQLSTTLRKVLNRKREKVPINRVQQLDSACLRWLTVQPGYTTAQKAGNKQRVLSVIRTETYNTLENRVFKDFLHLSIFECRRYIEEYLPIFPNSKKIKEVKRLQNLAITILALPIFEGISKIVNTPKPNYVLQNNPTYKIIWDLYKKLLRKTKLLEILWPKRHFLVEQYIHISILNIIKTFNINEWDNFFFSDPWIFFQPYKNKSLIANYLDKECVILNKNASIFISIENKFNSFYIKVQINNKIVKKYRLQLYYLFNTRTLENENALLIDLPRRTYTDINIIYFEDAYSYFDTTLLKNKTIVLKSNDDIYSILRDNLLKILSSDLGETYV